MFYELQVKTTACNQDLTGLFAMVGAGGCGGGDREHVQPQMNTHGHEWECGGGLGFFIGGHWCSFVSESNGERSRPGNVLKCILPVLHGRLMGVNGESWEVSQSRCGE